MVCVNCTVNKNRTVTCKDCGYDNTYITHTMGNAIALERETEKARRMKNGK